MKIHANFHRVDFELHDGDWVYLCLQPFPQQTIAQQLNQKLSPRYFSPSQMLKEVDVVAYQLEVPPNSKGGYKTSNYKVNAGLARSP